MRYKIIEIAVCEVCMHLMCNGEYNDGTNRARDCVRGQHAMWGDDVRYLTPGSGEPWDSQRDCGGCGDTDHGDRYDASVMVPLNKIRFGAGNRTYMSTQDGSHVEIWDGDRHVSTITRDWRNRRRLYPADVA